MSAMLSGLVLELAIGAGCRWFDLPLPAPPRLVGALLVLAMTARLSRRRPGDPAALSDWVRDRVDHL